MCKCKECKYYDDRDTYPGTGKCELDDDFVKENDTCEYYED